MGGVMSKPLTRDERSQHVAATFSKAVQDTFEDQLKAAVAEEREKLREAFRVVTAAEVKAAIANEREEIAQFIEQTNLGSLPEETAIHYALLLKSYATAIRARGQA